MARGAFSAQILDTLVSGSSWTRDVPKGFIARTFPGMVPAEEGNQGRGCPVFDLYRKIEVAPGILDEQAVSMKVHQEKRNPRNVVITTGVPDHIQAFLGACALPSVSVPCYVLNWNGETWNLARFDVAELFRVHGLSDKAGDPLVLRRAIRKYFSQATRTETVYTYHEVRVNIGRVASWSEVSDPRDLFR